MKKIIFLILNLVLLDSTFAQTFEANQSITIEDEIEFSGPQNKIKIKEIKNYLATVNPDSSCMDEYIKRRKQLILKIVFSPATIAAGSVASFYVGGATGVGLAYLTGTQNQWAGLGYVVGGAVLGTAAATITFTADTVSGALRLSDNELILKALAEHYLNRSENKLEKLYSKVTKKIATPPSLDEFRKLLINLDESGKLCDGSIVKKPIIRIGSKLKYKVARSSDLKKLLVE